MNLSMSIRVLAICRRAALVFAAFLAFERSVFAQPVSAAETLFREGKVAEQAGDWVTACRKYDESNALEAAPGLHLNLAACEERQGHLLAAARHYSAAGSMFKSGDARIPFARSRLDLVERRIPEVTLVVSGSPSSVTIDGTSVDKVQFGRPLKIDPGRHAFSIRFDAGPETLVHVDVREGESRTIALVPSDPKAVSPPQTQVPSAPPPRLLVGPSRAIGWSVLTVGAVSSVVGVVALASAVSSNATVQEHCPGASCDDVGFAAQESRNRSTNVSVLTLGAGVTSVAVGLFSLAYRPFDHFTPVVANDGAGIRFNADL